MRVICIFNKGSGLSSKTLDVIHSRDALFCLKIDRHYTVYGMVIWVGVLHYLVIDTWGFPSWSPAGLFAVLDDKMDGFHFKFYGGYSIHALWGYKDLLDDLYYDWLIERQKDVLEIFWVNKALIDSQKIDPENGLSSGNAQHMMRPILQNYYDRKTTAQEFAASFNSIYKKLIMTDLHDQHQRMVSDVYAVTYRYSPTTDYDEALRNKIQKLYFLILSPHAQFTHQ